MKRLPIRWSKEAVENLRFIRNHISLDSPKRATDFCKKLIKNAGSLRILPHRGREVPELWDQNPTPREILTGEYRLIYRVNSKRVEIVMIVHARRILPGCG
ncbi:MAG: type II toxin-antitoxin system RelE/ParE family toxin [Elusimicrobiota bacterium]